MDRTTYINADSRLSSYQSSPIISPKVSGSLGQGYVKPTNRLTKTSRENLGLRPATSRLLNQTGSQLNRQFPSAVKCTTSVETGEKRPVTARKDGGSGGGLTRKLLHSGISRVAIPKEKDREEIQFQYGNVLVLHLQCKNISTLTPGGLDPFFNLKNLYLYKNNIRRIQGLDALNSLELLDLSRNNVERIDNLENCTKLKKLFLGFNEIQVVEGLEALTNLEELYIDDQDVPPEQPLLFSPGIMSSLVECLIYLDISSNQLKSIEPIAGLTFLHTLLAGKNLLSKIDSVVDTLESLRQLRVLTLKGNPIASKPYYKSKIIGSVFRLELLDGKEINDTTRTCVQKLRLIKENRAQRRSEAALNKKQSEPTIPSQKSSHHIIDPGQTSEFTFSTPTRQSPLPPPKVIAQKKAMNMKATYSPQEDPNIEAAATASSYQLRSRHLADDHYLVESSDGQQMSDMAKVIFRLSNLDELGPDGDSPSNFPLQSDNYWQHPGPVLNECRPLSPLEDEEYYAGMPSPRTPKSNETEAPKSSSRPKPAAPGGRQSSNNSSSLKSIPDFTMTGSHFQPRHYYGGALSPLIELPTPESLTARDENAE